jgi:EAL and modified HD-GYP domain-containing signal transduction protein
VLSDAVLTLGLDTLTGGRRAFINMTRHMLLNELVTVLPPEIVVVEVLENVTVDAEVIEACRRLRERGYTLALDDFTFATGAAALLPFARYVKVDVLSTPAEERRRIEATVPPGVKLVAEKVESSEVFEEARALGYGLFQGYYFCRPTTFSGGALSARRLAYARLLAALNQPSVSVNGVEDLIKHDASLTYRVLRCINSAAFGVRREIQSIRQALVLLGLDQVRKWASVWALAGLNGGSTSELVTIAILRARSCELVATQAFGAEEAPEYFLLGLCSVLDAMLGQPMETAIAELPLSDNVRQALLGTKNSARSVLDAVIAHERGEWDDAAAIARGIAVTPERLPAAYADALKWARELTQLSAAAA